MAQPGPASPFERKCADTVLFVIFVCWLLGAALSQSMINTLPGFTGALPFKLETGYVSVGESDQVQLFYYFVESERDPLKDPLVLWISGGPGCSGFSALVYEVGPLVFNFPGFNGSLPSFLLNSYSWTKVANIIFLDVPAVSGFSYATTLEAYLSSDIMLAKDAHYFLRKWLLDHPRFLKHPLYLSGGSYSGKSIPMVALEILNGNEAGATPHINFKGYLLGNPVAEYHKEQNSRIVYAREMALIPDDYYKFAKSHCDGEYIKPDLNNALCMKSLQLIHKCIGNVNYEHILEPVCAPMDPKSSEIKFAPAYVEDFSVDLILQSLQQESWCRSHYYQLSNFWANDPSVQESLYIRKGTKAEWLRCHRNLKFDRDVSTVIEHHYNLSQKGCRTLIYSGDHDLVIPYIATLEWIRHLNMSVEENWRPWFVNGQIAGFTEQYSNQEGSSLTFATVKGAGHTAVEYKRKECLAMVDRWFSNYEL